LYKTVLDWRRRFVGDKIETSNAAIETRTQLADSYDKAKRYAEATEQFKIILERHLEHGLAEDAETNRIVSRLAENLYNQRTPATYNEAEVYYRSNLEWRQRHRSTEYQSLMIATSNVADCLEQLNRNAEAAPYYREWARIREAVFGADDQKTMQALVSLGKALIRAGNACLATAGRDIAAQHFAEAIEPLSRAANWTRTKNGPNVEITTAWVQLLGNAYFGLGKFGDAKDCFSENLVACDLLFGTHHSKTHQAITELRNTAMELGEWSNAETLSARKVDCLQREGADEKTIIEQASILGVCRARQGKFAEAAEDIAALLAWRKEHLGLADFATIRACYWHAKCLESFQNYAAAVAHYELVVEWKGDIPPIWIEFHDDAKERLGSCRSHAAILNDIGRLKVSE
jgi:hypothetical protein